MGKELKKPKVFIVVLTYNGAEFIKRCLKSLFNLSYSDMSIVVVDNNSTDGTLEIAKRDFSRAIFLKNDSNLGFAAGVNVGIRFSLERMADYVVLLNQDTEVEPDFLEKIVEIGENNKEIGILSPVIFRENERQVWFSGGEIDWSRMRVIHKTNSFQGSFLETNFISGCAMVIKKEVFQKIGLFDEDFFLYYEDADFSFRSQRAGFKNVVVANSWVYHLEASQRAENQDNKLYWLVLSGLIFFFKNASFWKKKKLKVYVFLRKIKNRKDLFFRKDFSKAKIIRKAFNDFKNVS